MLGIGSGAPDAYLTSGSNHTTSYALRIADSTEWECLFSQHGLTCNLTICTHGKGTCVTKLLYVKFVFVSSARYQDNKSVTHRLL